MSASAPTLSPSLFYSAIDAVDIGVVIVDVAGQLVYANSQVEHFLAVRPSSGDLATWLDKLSLCFSDGITLLPTPLQPIVRALAGEEITSVDVCQPGETANEPRELTIVGRVLRSKDGNVDGALMTVGPSQSVARAPLVSEIANAMSVPLFLLDVEGEILLTNRSARQLVDCVDRPLLGKSFWDFLDEDKDAPDILQWWHSKSESSQLERAALVTTRRQRIPVEATVGHLSDHQSLRCVVVRDLSAHERIAEDLVRATVENTFYDPLTRLANRVLFYDRLQRSIEQRKYHQDQNVAVLVFDVDRFGVVNDTHGPEFSDQLLTAIAVRLQNGLRSGDTVGRLSADEFGVLLDDTSSPQEATRTAMRLQQELAQPYRIKGKRIYVSLSSGIAIDRGHYARGQDLLRDAEAAMYRAKSEGKGGQQVFDLKLHSEVRERLELETDLRDAIDNEKITIHYQPIVSISDAQPRSFEALARWEHPHNGLIPPSQFIPLAEESGLIIALDRYVLRRACIQMAKWQRNQLSPIPLSVNVNFSGKQFARADVVNVVEETLAESGLQPQQLNLEITESMILQNQDDTVRLLAQLRELGVQLQIDDFGTGYSSLSYLVRMPVNAVKIDRSFVSNIQAQDRNFEIVRAIIALAGNLKLNVIAEGIETAEQLATLKTLGCEYGQGYFFAPPMAAQQASDFLHSIQENISSKSAVQTER